MRTSIIQTKTIQNYVIRTKCLRLNSYTAIAIIKIFPNSIKKYILGLRIGLAMV